MILLNILPGVWKAIDNFMQLLSKSHFKEPAIQTTKLKVKTFLREQRAKPTNRCYYRWTSTIYR